MSFSAPAPRVTVSLEKEQTVTAAALPTPSPTVGAAPKKTTTLLERLTGIVSAAAPTPSCGPSAAANKTTVVPPSAPTPPAPVPTAPTVILQSSPLGTLRTVSVPEPVQTALVALGGGPTEGKPRVLPSATYAGATEPFWATEGAGGAPDTWSQYPAIADVNLDTLNIENVGTIFFGPGLTDGLTQVGGLLEYNGDIVVTGPVVTKIVVGSQKFSGEVSFTASGSASIAAAANSVDIFVPTPPPQIAVDSLNTLTGALTLTSTTNTVTITPSGNTIDLEVQPTAVVDKLNGLTGEVVLASNDSSITITPDALTGKIDLSAPGVTPTAWANYPAIHAVDLASNILTDATGDVKINSDAALTLGKNQINLRAENGALGGSIALLANSGTLGTNGGLIDLTANGGSAPTGLYGQVNIVANPGTLTDPITGFPVTTGGAINIQANSGGSITTATSKVVLNAGGINIYSGVGTPFGSLFGYTYINASLGISLVAGAFTSGLQAPGTVYLYGTLGITLGSDTYAGTIYPILGNDLTINGRVTGEGVNINNAKTIAFNAGGALTGVATINGSAYPPAGSGVTSLNTLSGAVDLAPGSGIAITPSGNTLTIDATAQTQITNGGASVACTATGGVTVTTANTTPADNRLTIATNGGISLISQNETILISSFAILDSNILIDAGANQIFTAGDGGVITNSSAGSISLQARDPGPVAPTAALNLSAAGTAVLSGLPVGGAVITASDAGVVTLAAPTNLLVPNLAAATTANVVYYDTTSKAVSYGPPAAAGSTTYFPYQADSGATPTTGHISWSNFATQISSTYIRVNHIDQDTVDIDLFLNLIQQGNTLILQDANVSGNFQTWLVSGTPIPNTGSGYAQFPITLVSSGGSTNFANNHQIILAIVATSTGTTPSAALLNKINAYPALPYTTATSSTTAANQVATAIVPDGSFPVSVPTVGAVQGGWGFSKAIGSAAFFNWYQYNPRFGAPAAPLPYAKKDIQSAWALIRPTVNLYLGGYLSLNLYTFDDANVPTSGFYNSRWAYSNSSGVVAGATGTNLYAGYTYLLYANDAPRITNISAIGVPDSQVSTLRDPYDLYTDVNHIPLQNCIVAFNPWTDGTNYRTWTTVGVYAIGNTVIFAGNGVNYNGLFFIATGVPVVGTPPMVNGVVSANWSLISPQPSTYADGPVLGITLTQSTASAQAVGYVVLDIGFSYGPSTSSTTVSQHISLLP